MPGTDRLPIDAVIPDLLAALRTTSNLVLQAPTGAGKTTRVAPALLDAGLVPAGQILLLEPRRLAARAAARRMSSERHTPLGQEIGYQVRFDQRCSAQTRILSITDGILLRRLQSDPFLESVSAILFDEFHERSLNVDLALAMARRVQQTVRPDLKLLVMSATLSAEPVARYLGHCPIITSEGRLYPVDIRYRPPRATSVQTDDLLAAVLEMLQQTPGDLLVFLPGIREIQRLDSELRRHPATSGMAILSLYGDLPPEEQDRVLSRLPQRKIVLATNVAETSVTIDGITGVIDSGQVRQLQFDPGLGLDRLLLTRISQASSDQRAGRAGRTQPGVCLRLWQEREQRGRPVQTEPEIRRVDLASAVLELLCWGEPDVLAFPWFEAPQPAAVAQALQLLTSLEAIEDGKPTELGRRMVELPVHPRVARLLLAGHTLGQAQRASWVAALLTERDPFVRSTARSSGPHGPQPQIPTHFSASDVLDRVLALEEFARTGRTATSYGDLHAGSARALQQVQQQLVRLVPERPRSPRTSTAHNTVGHNAVGHNTTGHNGAGHDGTSQNSTEHATTGQGGHATPQASGITSPTGTTGSVDAQEALLRSILTAYPDRVARRREPHSRKGVMVGGRGVRLADSSHVLQPEFFVCVDTEGGSSEILVRMASGIRREWLASHLVETSVDVTFDLTTEKVQALRRTRYGDLSLDEVTVPPPANCDLSQVLAEAAATQLDRVIPWDQPELHSFVTRLRCLREWLPDANLPAFTDEELRAILPALASRCRSFADLRQAPWLQTLRGTLTYSQQQFLDHEAPERLAVPSGSHITVQYEVGRPPILAVRIQELFGLAATPRIARGRIPVVLHLLGPNYRPQQITDDLTSFWNNTYPEVRKELRRRYPKHAWPDDPWTAAPERKPGRRS